MKRSNPSQKGREISGETSNDLVDGFTHFVMKKSSRKGFLGGIAKVGLLLVGASLGLGLKVDTANAQPTCMFGSCTGVCSAFFSSCLTCSVSCTCSCPDGNCNPPRVQARLLILFGIGICDCVSC